MADNKMTELNDGDLRKVAGGDNKEKKWITYHVIEGDSLSKIAYYYSVTVDELRSWNNISGPDVKEGDTLSIYTINY